MKHFSLFLLIFFGLYGNIFCQNRLLSIIDKTIPLIDSTYLMDSNKYYLINNSKYEIPKNLISRRLENNYIIVKGVFIHPLKLGIKYINFKDHWKLSPWLSMENTPSSAKQAFSLKYSNNASLDFIYDNTEINVLREIKNAHLLIIETTYDIIINNLIHSSEIEYIDVLNRKPIEETPLRQYNPDINRISTAKYNFPALTGSGFTASLKENSIIENDIDLLGKITLDQNSSTEFTQHAKEMGTLIAGFGNSHKTGEGVATNASLVCTDFSSLFAEDNTYYNQHNITVQNHSYGTGVENFYGNETISYDQLAIDNPTLVHVFSAGNAGTTAPAFGNYAGIEGYANLTGNFKQAKNVLVIAALDSTLNHVSLTSSGPAYDGRVKPELAAFGGEGTSESAALASGSAVMIQNQYSKSTGSLPTSALVKSLLIAGANEAHTKGIDFRTGYGSINLNKSLQLVDKQSYVESSLPSNSTYNYQLTIPANTAELKVVVSWIDPPANPEDVIALVNDLDMVIIMPNNNQVLPWVLDSSPNSTSLAALPTRAEDHLNNVEMITVENPVEGVYSIQVNSNQLQGASQAFSIAYNIKQKDVFEWSYPTPSDHVEATTTPYLRWENTYENQTGELSIQYGNGNWETIGPANLNDEYFKYKLKDTTVSARLKMSVAGTDYTSGVFSITKAQEVSVENDCEDAFILAWNSLENTESYTLYELQANRLAPILTTADTLLTLDKKNYTGNVYAIKPTLTNGLEGLKSFAINIENKNTGCYLTDFLVLLDEDGVANIRLGLNVPFQIDEVVINKEFQLSSEVFQQFIPGNQPSFLFKDDDLTPGIYYYSTQLKTMNGELINSDTLSLFYTDDNTAIAFPNPVEGNVVNILNNYPGGVLQIVDSKGAVIKNYDLVNTVEPIELAGITKGVYIYRILFEDKVVNSGRIIRL